jgi:hypothetical protein
MHRDIDASTEVRDICDRGGRRSGRKRPLLADIRQTTNSVNPLCAVSDSWLAASSNGRTVCDTPSHPSGEWPTSANERYLLQKLSLFRVAAFFIADVGNGCAAKYLSDITAYFELTFSTVESRTLLYSGGGGQALSG